MDLSSIFYKKSNLRCIFASSMPIKTKVKTKKADSALADLVVQGLLNKKGKDILKMDLHKLEGAISDYFVICTGTSDTHVQALADSVHETVKKATGENTRGTEGEKQGEWILMDYVDVVVHIFLKEKRGFYNIEELWGDAKFEKIDSES